MTRSNATVFDMGVELSISTLTGGGTYDLIGVFSAPPAVVIFDNQGTGSVEISKDGANTWKTFVAGEALVLDLRGQHANAPDGAFRQGTPMYAVGAAGACDFRISYIYPESN